ncbi:MAG: DUF6242 domain-containing protein [Tannerellaceae bacterium]|jgi:hypothetical protein|nr:DUF6242 domain-containing protein [Tannerellaceae bacterium]
MKKIVVFIAGCITLLSLTSCLGSNDSATYVIRDAQIASFTLKNDSVAGLANVKFTIDQLNGQIFNLDSMPYGTKLENAVCTLEYVMGVAGIQAMQEATGDTIWWNGTDSLNFSKPVKFVTTAYDLVTTKTYFAQVNIHQVQPDTMIWEKYAGQLIGQAVEEQKVAVCHYNDQATYFMYVKSTAPGKGYELYSSPVTDAKTWTALPLTGLPASDMRISQFTEYEGFYYMPSSAGALYTSGNGRDWQLVENAPVVRSLLGVVDAGVKQSSVLSVVAEQEDGTLRFAGMDKGMQWTYGDAVPAGFPLSGFGSIRYHSMYHEYLMVVAGLNAALQPTNHTWATANATNWVLLTNPDIEFFEKKEGVMLTRYDEKFYLIGGINAAGEASKEILFSIDNGVSWAPIDSMVVLPEEYKARGYASVHVDQDNYMLIFGGKTSQQAQPLDELWRGRINRLGFKK